MSEIAHSIYSTLVIGGHQFDPAQITELTGISPTKIWTQQHSWIKKSHPEINSIEWRHEINDQINLNLGDAIVGILDLIWTRKEELRQYLSDNKLKLFVECRPFGDASVFEYIIHPRSIDRLAFFGASLTLAVY